MARERRIYLAAALLAILYVTFTLKSDAGPVRQVKLKEEYLSISLKPGPEMHVTVDFYFTGNGLSGMELAFPEDYRTIYKNFQAAMIFQGMMVKLQVTREEAPPDHLFDFHAARYPALYRMKIPEDNRSFHHRVSYNARLPYYFRHGSKGELPSGYAVHYILITGSTWKGKVDLLRVKVDPGPFKCEDLFPTNRSVSGNCRDDGKWHYEDSNLELKKDVELVLKVKENIR